MIPAPPRAISSAAHAWDIMRDDVTLRHSLMTTGFNEQRQKDLLSLGYEARQRGNAGYYFPARVEVEIRDTNERAQALYSACCDVWENHGLKRSRAFYRAIFDNCLEPLFGTRRSTINAELQLRDGRMGTPGNSSAASGSLARRMDQLRATWNQRLEKEARDSDTRERIARERAVLLPATQLQSAPAFMNREGDGGVTVRKIEQVREVASDFSWKELEMRFRDIQAKAPGQNVRANFTRTEWKSGSVSEEWMVSGDPICRSTFEDLASIATRKLGCATNVDTKTYWLDRVRQWMEQAGLDKDKSVAWWPTGDVNERGKIGTAQGMFTERIAELSARFCVNLISRGTPESTVASALQTQPMNELGPPTADESATLPTARNVESKKKPGRHPTRDREFQTLAGKLWLEEMTGAKRVSLEGLKRIASRLDASDFKKPSDYLEGKAAKELKAHNRNNGNSPAKRIMTWTALVESGDPEHLRAMSRTLSRCGRNVRK